MDWSLIRNSDMKQTSKKELALSMKAAGRTVEEIASALQCSPTYVANCLTDAGKITEYTDLYTSSVVQNEYARMFSGVLRFRNVEVARDSVAKIDALFHQFAQARDRRGQHQAQLMALIGKNRAEGIGKLDEAKVFLNWLVSHLDTATAPACDEEKMAEAIEREYAQVAPYEMALAFV